MIPKSWLFFLMATFSQKGSKLNDRVCSRTDITCYISRLGKSQESFKAGLVCPNLFLLFSYYRGNVLISQVNEKPKKKSPESFQWLSNTLQPIRKLGSPWVSLVARASLGVQEGAVLRVGSHLSPGFAFSEGSLQLHLLTNCMLCLSFWHISGMWWHQHSNCILIKRSSWTCTARLGSWGLAGERGLKEGNPVL